MARNITCDICRKPTTEIVAKLYYSPLKSKAKSSKSTFHHSTYSHHLDVGVCCAPKIMQAWGWRKRTTAAEYHESRRKGRGE